MDIYERYRNAEKLLTPYTREAVLNGAPNVRWVSEEVFKYDRESYDRRGDMVKSPVYFDIRGNSVPDFDEEGQMDRYALEWDKGNIILIDKLTGETKAMTDDAEPFYEYGCYIDMYSQLTVKRRGYEEKPLVCWSPDRTKFVTYLADRRNTKHFYAIKSFFEEEEDCIRPELLSYPGAVVTDSDEEIPHYWFYIGDCIEGTMTRVNMPPYLYPVRTSDARSMVKWQADSKHFYFTWLARGYQEGRLYLVDAEDGSSDLVFTEKSDTFLNLGASGILDGFGPYMFSNYITEDRKTFFWWSEKSGYAHLYRYNMGEGEGVDLVDRAHRQLVVQKIQRIDEGTEKIYFIANNDPACSDPLYFNLYVVNFDGTGFARLTPEDACHKVFVGEKAFVDTYSRVDLPPVTVLRRLDGSFVKEIVRADVSRLMSLGYVMPERFKVKASDGVTDIYGIMVRPVKPESDKVPLMDYIYGAAQMYNVPRTFTYDNDMDREIMGGLQQFAQLGIAGVIIDGIGTPGRGKAFHDVSFRKFEQCDGLADHVYCYKELREKYPFIDLDRIGIWGNSGGGYGTVTAMLTYPQVYKAGVASSGNYDNRMYEHSWTERYGGLYDREVYARGDATRLAQNLSGKLLLAYGALDDNVTMSETIRLCDKLNKYNKDYDLMVLPRMNHNVPSDLYFIRRKLDHFTKYLLGIEPPKEYKFRLMDK